MGNFKKLEKGNKTHNLSAINSIVDDFNADVPTKAACDLMELVIKKYPNNTDKGEILQKIWVVDRINKANLKMHHNADIQIAETILANPHFDKMLKDGNAEAVNIIAKQKIQKIEKKEILFSKDVILFSFASKYCAYHSLYLYDDKFSIFDNLVNTLLPKYAKDFGLKNITTNKLYECKAICDYEKYRNYINQFLKACGLENEPKIHRKLDNFLWWQMRQKKLKETK